MYHIASFDKFEKDAVVTLELDSLAGLHAFTFGS